MAGHAPQQFTIRGSETIHVEVDRDFTVRVEFSSELTSRPIVPSGDCVNSLGYAKVSPTAVEYHMVAIKLGKQELDFGSGCVAKVAVMKATGT